MMRVHLQKGFVALVAVMFVSLYMTALLPGILSEYIFYRMLLLRFEEKETTRNTTRACLTTIIALFSDNTDTVLSLPYHYRISDIVCSITSIEKLESQITISGESRIENISTKIKATISIPVVSVTSWEET
jgi:hypothetical protein